MERLQNTLTHFNMPIITEEQRKEAEEYERQQARQEHLKRVELARIPERYRNADVGQCVSAVREYAESFSKETSRGIVLVGSTGVGKTYSGCAILNRFVDTYLVGFVTADELLREIRSTFNSYSNMTEHDVVMKYVNKLLLMLDDLGKEKPSEFALGVLFSIINARYNKGKPTIVTTQYHAEDLIVHLAEFGYRETAEAIVSRLQESVIVQLEGEDRRIRY